MLDARVFEGAVARLRDAGLTPTYPHIVVARLLLDGEARPSVDDIVERARDDGLPLSAEQVARTMADLARAGVAPGERPSPAPLARLAGAPDHACRILRAIANPWRLKILCQLSAGEKPVGAMEAALGIGQSALSQHLARLRELRLVRTRRRRQQILYSLDRESEPGLRLLLDTVARACRAGEGEPGLARLDVTL